MNDPIHQDIWRCVCGSANFAVRFKFDRLVGWRIGLLACLACHRPAKEPAIGHKTNVFDSPKGKAVCDCGSEVFHVTIGDAGTVGLKCQDCGDSAEIRPGGLSAGVHEEAPGREEGKDE